ncbi:hypothetical protein N8328_00945 [Crocinitomicaceae bacterium]|nr:hypothetical protein [Crocinitomicaceae bacterium]MDC1402954.1 hypothetical protein [Crocinitomicaceae bacterium]
MDLIVSQLISNFLAGNAIFNICLTVSDVYAGYVCESTYCDIIPLDEEFSIYVPNAFTPNDNEHNNEFRAIVLG